jgi:DNA-binding transcriptional LysR family regulator
MATGSITKYRALVRTVECGNMSAAASSMQYTQSAFSHMISSLEAKLGFKMIVRQRSGIRLTPEGEQIYGKIKEILALQEEVKAISARIRGAAPGIVRIGGSAGLIAALASEAEERIHASWPELTLVFSDGDTEEIIRDLEEGTIDIGLVSEDPGVDYTFQPLTEESLCVLMPKDHPLAKKETLTCGDLAGEPAVGFSRSEVGRIRSFLRIEPQEGVLFCSSVPALTELVKAGRGLLTAGSLELEAFRDPELTVRELEDAPKRTLGAAFRRLTQTDKMIYPVLSLVREMFGENGEADPE